MTPVIVSITVNIRNVSSIAAPASSSALTHALGRFFKPTVSWAFAEKQFTSIFLRPLAVLPVRTSTSRVRRALRFPLMNRFSLTSDEQFWSGRLSRNGFVGMVAPRKETMHHRW